MEKNRAHTRSESFLKTGLIALLALLLLCGVFCGAGAAADDNAKITISFDPGDGSGTMTAKTVESGTSIILPKCTFTAPNGKTFLKWAIGSHNAQSYYVDGQRVTRTGSVILYAIWSKQDSDITITFNPGDGSGTMASQTITGILNVGSTAAPVSTTVQLNKCTFTAPSGKEFIGWSGNNGKIYTDCEGVPWTQNDVKNITLTAQWETPRDLPPNGGALSEGYYRIPGKAEAPYYTTITLENAIRGTNNKLVVIDLNGGVLKPKDGLYGSAIIIGAGEKVTLKDSNPQKEHKFTPANADDLAGQWTWNESSGTETRTGGVITGFTTDRTLQDPKTSGNYGGAVCVDGNGATFTMQGGNIIGNYANKGGDGGGGGIYAGGYAILTITGGKIVGNETYWYGGGVEAGWSTPVDKHPAAFSMENCGEGTEISYNKAVTGGGIGSYMGFKLSGPVDISHNHATGLDARDLGPGGGIFLWAGNGDAEIHATTDGGPTITYNTADGNGGGGISAEGAMALTMTAGTVTHNKITGTHLNKPDWPYEGGGIMVKGGGGSGAGIYLSGTVVVKDNYKIDNDTAKKAHLNNVYLEEGGDKLVLTNRLTGPGEDKENPQRIFINYGSNPGDFGKVSSTYSGEGTEKSADAYKFMYDKGNQVHGIIKENTTDILTWGDLYTVHFNNKDGTKAADDQSVYYNNYATKPDGEKTGYTDHWYNEQECHTEWNFSSDKVQKETTLWRDWIPNTYTITYKDKGGGAYSGDFDGTQPTQHTYDTETALVNGKKAGYTFGGWYISSDCSGTALTKLGKSDYTENITLYAKWTPNSYTITYKDEEDKEFSGTHETGYPTTHTYDTATTLKSATKAGYTLEGWYTDSACTEGKKITTIGAEDYTENITLFAKWTLNAPTLKFDGTDEMSEGGTKTLTYDGADHMLTASTAAAGTITYQWSKKNESGAFVEVSESEGGKNASLTRKDVTHSGTYKVTITDQGGKTSEKTVTITISPRDISNADLCTIVTDLSDKTYTGDEIKQSVVIKHKDESVTLTEDTDYTLTYSSTATSLPAPDLTDVGTVTVTITGKGNYTGTPTKTYKVVEKSIAKDDTTGGTVPVSVDSVSDQTYTGHPITPEVTIKYYGKDLKKKDAGGDNDYSLAYENNTDAADPAAAKITISGHGNYKEAREVFFKIVPKDLNDCEVDAIPDQEYTGYEIKPTITIKNGDVTLDPATEYELEYSDNIRPGTATITIKPKSPNYTGTKTVHFTILNGCTVTYNGNGATGGAAPVDSFLYPKGAEAAVLDSGTLVRAGYVFAGWAMNPDESGTIYQPGYTFTISTDVTLYAVWDVGKPVLTFDGEESEGVLRTYDGEIHELRAESEAPGVHYLWWKDGVPMPEITDLKEIKYIEDSGVYAVVAVVGDKESEAVEMSVSIVRMKAYIGAKDQTIYAGDQPKQGPEWATLIYPLCGEDRLTDIKFIKNEQEKTVIGADAVIMCGDVDVTHNYDIEYAAGKLTVKHRSSPGHSEWAPEELPKKVIVTHLTEWSTLTAFIETAEAPMARVAEVDEEYAQEILARKAAAEAAGIVLINSKGAEPIVILEEDIPYVDREVFTEIAQISYENGDPVETVEFTIPKIAVTEKGLTTDDVTIYRYHYDYELWIPLETSLVSDDGVSLVYQAPGEGADLFAILVKKAGPKSVPVTEPATTPKSSAPAAGILAAIGAAAVLGLRKRK